MRSATRLLVVTLLGVLVALVPATTAAALPPDREYGLVQQQPPPPTGPTTAPSATSAPSVELEPAETEADRQESRRKLVMGIVSVVLIGIVVWGRSIRRKKKSS